MEAGMTSYYEVMGLHRRTLAGKVRDTWRVLARVTHPDVGGSLGAFAVLTQAYAVLGDAARRKAYDLRVDATGDPCPRCGGRGFVAYCSATIPCRGCRGTGAVHREGCPWPEVER